MSSMFEPQSWFGQNFSGTFVQDFGFIFSGSGSSMLVEQALVKLLRDNAEVAAIFGVRIYPAHLKQTETYPALVYGLVNRDSQPVLDSITTTPPNSLYAFVTHAKAPLMRAYEIAKLGDDAIRRCLAGFSGVVTLPDSSPVESVNIQGIFFVRGADDKYDDAIQVQRIGSAFHVRHSQSL